MNIQYLQHMGNIYLKPLLSENQEMEAKSVQSVHYYNLTMRNEIIQPHKLK
jgi:hypothetical protein